MTKKELRQKCREIISSSSIDYIRLSGEAIEKKVMHSEQFQNCSEIFIYVNMKNEPATAEIMDAAWKSGKRVFVPKCREGGRMDIVQIRSRGDLAPGMMGIPEPVEDVVRSSPEMQNQKSSLAVIPCMAASCDGRRLGHGAGYYDRFLEHFRGYKMCLCFGCLLSDEIPMDAHDVMMDAVVTE